MNEIKHYALRMYGGPHGSNSGIRGQIHLFSPSNKMLGKIDFYDTDHTLPPDASEPYIHSHMHISEWPLIVDMLRNEAPVYLSYHSGSDTIFLSTSQEPVGEGE